MFPETTNLFLGLATHPQQIEMVEF